MATYYVKSGAGAADYNAAHLYSTGDKMVPSIADVTSNVSPSRKWVWECTTGGTTNGAISWNAAPTQDVTTITQNGVVFTARKPGFSSGTTANWAYATIYIQYACNAAQTAGDIIYVSNNHSESQSSAYSMATNITSTSVVCVSDAAAPPTAVALTAAVTTTNNSNITLPVGYTYGIVFTAGSGASGTASITTGGTSVTEKCQFILASTGTSSRIVPAGSSRLLNCDFKFASASHQIAVNAGGGWTWTGGSLLAGGTSPTTVADTTQGSIFSAPNGILEDIDLTNASAGVNLSSNSGNILWRNVKLPASWSGVLAPTPGNQFVVYNMHNADNAATDYRITSVQYAGTLTQETSITKSGGASDGTTALSWKLVATANARYPQMVLICPEIVKWNASTSSITVTVDIVSSAAINDDDIWLEVSYLGTSGAPLGTFISSAKANFTAGGSAVTTSTATWNNPPATPAYQKLQVTFTPASAGFIHAVVKLAKASKTVYVDPVLQVSGVTSSAQRQIPGGMFINEIASGGYPASRVFTGM